MTIPIFSYIIMHFSQSSTNPIEYCNWGVVWVILFLWFWIIILYRSPKAFTHWLHDYKTQNATPRLTHRFRLQHMKPYFTAGLIHPSTVDVPCMNNSSGRIESFWCGHDLNSPFEWQNHRQIWIKSIFLSLRWACSVWGMVKGAWNGTEIANTKQHANLSSTTPLPACGSFWRDSRALPPRLIAYSDSSGPAIRGTYRISHSQPRRRSVRISAVTRVMGLAMGRLLWPWE
jgi:hypothetical protein